MISLYSSPIFICHIKSAQGYTLKPIGIINDIIFGMWTVIYCGESSMYNGSLFMACCITKYTYIFTIDII